MRKKPPRSPGWGGKRAHAGRRAKLSDVEALLVGTEYCKRLKEIARQRAYDTALKVLDSRSADPADADFRLKKLQQLDVEERPKVLTAYYSDEHGMADPEAFDEILDDEDAEDILDKADLLRARRQALAPRGKESSRLISIPIKRPQGVERQLLSEVAVWATERLGKDVTPRMVRKCADEYRSIMSEVPDEEPET